MSSTPDPDFWGEGRPERANPSGRRGPSDRHLPARGSLDRGPRDHRPPFGDGLRDRVRDLWDSWRGDPRLGIAVLVAAAVVAGLVWYQIGAGGGSPARTSAAVPPTTSTADASDEPRSSGSGAPAPSRDDAGSTLIVHVAGAVEHPGVVELDAGARVIDALESAGGGVADADLDRLNLAAKLVDGQRVLVQRVGDPAVPDVTATGEQPGAGSDPSLGGETMLVNVNSATSVELEELPGIGPVLAEAIITERSRRGGFRSVNELRDVRGIGEKRFADLVDLVTV
ncbi:MAG: helix-hairpin-helix domain-containing protein [Acidimicrobiia bacterium]